MPGASNPGTLHEEVGGGAFNAARNAIRHGVDAAILSLRGGDLSGDAVATQIEACGMDDLSAVFLDRTTPSYTALLDRNGELIAGLADMGLYDLAFAKQIRRSKVREAVVTSDAILCDANMPTLAIERLIAHAGEKPVYAIGISPAKIVRLRPVMDQLAGLFLNRREALALSATSTIEDAVAALLTAGLENFVITAGSDPSVICADGTLYSLSPPSLADIIDVTGAGDALAGVCVAKLMQGAALDEAVRHGMAASMLTIASRSVVADYSPAVFDAALARVPSPQPV